MNVGTLEADEVEMQACLSLDSIYGVDLYGSAPNTVLLVSKVRVRRPSISYLHAPAHRVALASKLAGLE